MEVHVVSEMCIKPSSPTPHHLRSYKLSVLDQLAHDCVPLIFFYPNNDDPDDVLQIIRRLQRLKRSLADILPHFYPLAGRISEDGISVDCCDEGVYFVDAQVNCHLREFLGLKPDVLSLNEFLPQESAVDVSTAGIPAARIQVNVFKCGGMAIAVCWSHKILDGAGIGSFMRMWAARAYVPSGKLVSPNFSAAAGSSLFPAAGNLLRRASSDVLIDTLFKKGKFIKRRFVFDDASISKLKAKAGGSDGRFPTRVEAVSTFIWKTAMAASEQLHGHSRPSRSRHVVNLRNKLVPPVSDHVFGNLFWVVETSTVTAKQELNELVKELRDAKAKINDTFLGELRGEQACSLLSAAPEEMSSGSTNALDVYSFSSVCNLGLYDCDFGWGKPVWLSMTSKEINAVAFFNITVLFETRQGDGIEAWVTLEESQMNIFSQDKELLKFAVPDPILTLAGNFASVPRKRDSSSTNEKTLQLHDSQSMRLVSRI